MDPDMEDTAQSEVARKDEAAACSTTMNVYGMKFNVSTGTHT